MAKPKLMWYSLTVEQIEQRLNTARNAGLSFKEAEKRKRRGDSVFKFTDLSAADAIKLVLSDVAVYYILIIAVLCLVFQRWLEAAAAIVIVVLNCALTAMLKVISNKTENAVMAPSLPRCDVLREGKIVSIDARDVVEGDVVYLKAGDIVPCDVRIVKELNLRVYEWEQQNGAWQYFPREKCIDPISSDEVLRTGRIPNMISSNAMITGGYCSAIAVACGSKTQRARSGNPISIRSGNLSSELDEKINRLFKYITVVLLAMLVPFLFIALFSKTSSASPIDCIIQIGAVAASLPMQTVTVIYSTVMCCIVKYCTGNSSKDPTSSAIIKRYSAADKLSDVKKLFLIGKKSVTGVSIGVESVYAAFKDTASPELSENPADVKAALEHAFLINRASLRLSDGTVSRHDATFDGVLLNELNLYGASASEIISTHTVMSHKTLTGESAADVAIVSEGDDFKSRSFLICRSFDRSIVDKAAWYSSNGVSIMIDANLREKLTDVYKRYRMLGYEVLSVARSSSQLYDKSSFEEFEDQLIFEGMIAIGNVYSKNNPQSALELTKLGISPVICLEEETADSYYIVRNIFKNINSTPRIISASALKENDESVLSYPDADAYIGFDEKQIHAIIGMQHQRNISVATVATDFRYMRLAGKSDYVIAYTYDTFNESACSVEYPMISDNSAASCSVAKRDADMLVYPVTRNGGGIDGVLNAVKNLRPYVSNLNRVVSYLLFSLCARIAAVYLPLIAGRQAMSASMTLYLGCIVDLLAVMAIALAPPPSEVSSAAAKLGSPWSVIKQNFKSMMVALLCGVLIFAAGMMIPKTAVLESQSYTFASLLILQSLRLMLDLIGSKKSVNRKRIVFALIAAAAIIFVTLIFSLIPGVRTIVGLGGGSTAYIRALVITVITAPLVFINSKIFKNE